MRKIFILVLVSTTVISCKKNDISNNAIPTPSQQPMYFPPLSGHAWQTVGTNEVSWSETELNPLYDYLAQKNTKAFIILKNGKIAAEKYYGSFTVDSNWYWAS